MADEKSKRPEKSRKTLTDDQVTTERTLGRRSFLTAVGAVVAGGAAALALGDRLGAAVPARLQSNDPDKKPSDPDKKPSDPDKARDPDKKKMKEDPDKKKMKDPDKKKAKDPDKKKVGDPDKKPDPEKMKDDPDSRR